MAGRQLPRQPSASLLGYRDSGLFWLRAVRSRTGECPCTSQTILETRAPVGKLQTVKHDILNLKIRTSVNFNDTCRCGREQQAGGQAGRTIRTAIGHCRCSVSNLAQINAGQPPTRLRGMLRIWCGCQLQAGKIQH